MIVNRVGAKYGSCNTYDALGFIVAQDMSYQKHILENTSVCKTYKLSKHELNEVLKKYNI